MDDVYSVISPGSKLSRFLGLAPYNISGPPGNRIVRVSILKIAWGLALAAVYVGNMFISFLFGSPLVHNFQTSISNVETAYELVLAAFLLSASSINAPGFVRLYHVVNLVDRSLKTADVYVPWGVLRRDTIWRQAISVGQFAVIVVTSYVLIAVFGAQHITVASIFGFYTIFFSMKFVNYGFVSGYHTKVIIVHGLFVAINARLNEILQRRERLPMKTETARDKTVLKCLQKNHLRSCAVVENVNELFALSVLLYVGSVFGGLIIGLNNCFNSILTLKASDAAEDTKRMALLQIGLSLYVIAIFVTQLVRLCLACERCCQEKILGKSTITARSMFSKARRTALPVHKLLLDQRFSNSRSQLESFSLQLLQQQVKFSGGGFFNINAALLTSITGGATSLLVILIQFQLAPATKVSAAS